MTRYISTEGALAFTGTDHETQIVDAEMQSAIAHSQQPDENPIDPFLEAGEVTGVGDDIAPVDVEPVQQSNDPFDEGVMPSENVQPTNAVAALESIIEDLEETVDAVELPSPEGGSSDFAKLLDPQNGFFAQSMGTAKTEHNVTVQLDDNSKAELDSDVAKVIDADPVQCESLESIILCGERNVATLLEIFRNKVESLKSKE